MTVPADDAEGPRPGRKPGLDGRSEGPDGALEAEEIGRQSFLLQVHPGGISTVENLRTRERVRIEEPAAVGALVERWLAEASAGAVKAGRGAIEPEGGGRR